MILHNRLSAVGGIEHGGKGEKGYSADGMPRGERKDIALGRVAG